MEQIPNLEADLPSVGLAPTPEEKSHYRNFRVVPDAGQAYGYSVILPENWYPVEIPQQPISTEFSGIGLFSPYVPPLPPVLLSIGARVLTHDTTVADACEEYLETQEYEVLASRIHRYSVGDVVECLAVQTDTPFGTMKMRLAMFEDGGRLFSICGMSPLDEYPIHIRVLSLAMLSFQLLLPQGAQLPLVSE